MLKIEVKPLDKLFSKYIKLRDKVCQRCGCYSKYLQTSHYHGRAIKSTRWFDDNCCLLCMGCHMYFHGHRIDHDQFFLKRLGQERFDKLNMQAQMIEKHVDVWAITLYLREQIKKLG